MGRHGVKPAPKKVLQLRNTLRTEPGSTTPFTVEKPSCPSWLDKPSKALFRVLAAQLYEAGVSTQLDRWALARYCLVHTRWKKMEAFLAEHGPTCEVFAVDKEGTSRLIGVWVRPEARLAKELMGELRHLEKEFPFLPGSRVSMRMTPQPRAQEKPSKDHFFRQH